MAAKSRVYLPFFAVIAAPLCAAQLGILHERAARWIHQRRCRQTPPIPAKERSILALISMALLFPLLGLALSRLHPGGEPIESSRFPTGAVAWMDAHGAGGRIFNHYDWGGYLIFTLAPKSTVFVDGRAETLYPVRTLQECERAQRGDGVMATSMALKADYALWPKDHPMTRILANSPHWRVAYRDSTAWVFHRATLPAPHTHAH